MDVAKGLLDTNNFIVIYGSSSNSSYIKHYRDIKKDNFSNPLRFYS